VVEVAAEIPVDVAISEEVEATGGINGRVEVLVDAANAAAAAASICKFNQRGLAIYANFASYNTLFKVGGSIILTGVVVDT
jgi:hypothetical protein